LLCAGKPRREIVLPKPPFPEIGDVVYEGDTGRLVIGSEATGVFSFPIKKAPAGPRGRKSR